MARVDATWLFLMMYGVYVGSARAARPPMVVDNLLTSVDISTPVVKVTHYLNLTSCYDPAPVSWFYFTIDEVSAKHLSHIASFSDTHTLLTEKISDDPFQMQNHSKATAWKIYLIENLSPGKSNEVEIHLYFTSVILPDPEKITQGQSQLVNYTSNVLLYTPYVVQRQKTIVKLEKGTRKAALRFSQLEPTAYWRDAVIYGPYNNIQPFSKSQASIYFEMNTPIMFASELEREVTISHWGQISVRDTVKLINKGAALKGGFSRLRGVANAMKSFTSFLPAAATDVYFRDKVGTIYSFEVTTMETAVAVKLATRFPILGGWKSEFEYGYSMPVYEYLYMDGNIFYLTMPFLDQPGSMVVEDFILKVILPEGSQPLSVKVPDGMQKLNNGKVYSLLDTVGRNVLILTKKNIVDAAISDIEVWYTVPIVDLIRKPVIISSFIWLILSLYIVSNRIML